MAKLSPGIMPIRVPPGLAGQTSKRYETDRGSGRQDEIVVYPQLASRLLLTRTHAAADQIKAMITNVRKGFDVVLASAPPLPLVASG